MKAMMTISGYMLIALTAMGAQIALTHDQSSTDSTTRLSSVRISANYVTPGNTYSGEVELDGDAPKGGYSVKLESDNPDVTVPSSIKVNPNEDRASFTLSVDDKARTRFVSITATGPNGDSASTYVHVQTAKISWFNSLTTVTGGSDLNGQVYLDGPAPKGGMTIKMSSNDSDVSVPYSINVPDGQRSASFCLTTKKVTQTTYVTITFETESGDSKTLSITVF
jgi:hypothetical protein